MPMTQQEQAAYNQERQEWQEWAEKNKILLPDDPTSPMYDAKVKRAVAFDEGKLDHSLVPAEWAEWDVPPLQAGIDKGYARDNWKLSINTNEHDTFVRRRMNSLYRHFLAVKKGELIDPETGIPHMLLLICNAKFIHTYNVAKEKKENGQ